VKLLKRIKESKGYPTPRKLSTGITIGYHGNTDRVQNPQKINPFDKVGNRLVFDMNVLVPCTVIFITR